MNNEFKAQIIQNIMTTVEVANFLGVTKQMISILVRENKLPYLKEFKNGFIFFKPDVISYKNKFATERNSDIELYFTGHSPSTLNYALNWCEKAGELETIELYFWNFEALLDGYYFVNNDNLPNLPNNISLPTCVITSKRNKKLFVNGFNCGYPGTGPRFSSEFINKITNLRDMDRIIASNQIIKFFNNGTEWNYNCPNSRFPHNYSVDKNRIDTLFHFKSINKNIVVAQKRTTNFDLSPTDFLSLAKLFIPNPQKMYFFKTHKEAKENGYFLINNKLDENIYRIVIIDQNGNQLWLNEYSDAMLSLENNTSIKKLIEASGFEIPKVKLNEEILNWIKVKLFNTTPKSLFLSK